MSLVFCDNCGDLCMEGRKKRLKFDAKLRDSNYTVLDCIKTLFKQNLKEDTLLELKKLGLCSPCQLLLRSSITAFDTLKKSMTSFCRNEEKSFLQRFGFKLKNKTHESGVGLDPLTVTALDVHVGNADAAGAGSIQFNPEIHLRHKLAHDTGTTDHNYCNPNDSPAPATTMECRDDPLSKSKSCFTRDEITNELHRFISECDSQCELCCELVRQLSNHISEKHIKTIIKEKSRKRKRNQYEVSISSMNEKDRVLPPVEVKLSEVLTQSHPHSHISNTDMKFFDTLSNLKFEEEEIETYQTGFDDMPLPPDQHFTPGGDEFESGSDSESEIDFKKKLAVKVEPANKVLKTYSKRPRVKMIKPKPPKTDDKGKLRYTCRKCKEVFIGKDTFNDHYKTHEEGSDLAETDSGGKSTNSSKIEGNMMCGICKTDFAFMSDLIQHVQTMHGLERPHKCHVCEATFDFKGLNEHFELFHPEELPFVCTICSSTDEPKLTFFTLQQLRVHTRTVHTKRKVFPCDQCSRVFLNASFLTKHSKVHENGQKTHVCIMCRKAFDTLSELNAHKGTHVPRKHFHCQVQDCEGKFTSQEILDKHVQITHEKSVPPDPGENPNPNDTEQIKKRPPRAFACRLCTSAYTKFNNLWIHLRENHEDSLATKFKCYICQSKYYTALKLNEHMRNEHPSAKLFGCEICKLGFPRSIQLDEHVRRKHKTGVTGEKENPSEFVCPICKKTYAGKRNLGRHFNICHMGEMPYKCDQCDKAYAYPEHLTTHKYRHEGIKPFMCAQCGKFFVSKKNLYSHSQIHRKDDKFKPYACTGCNARFATKTLMNIHARIHAIKSHMCEICGKSFRILQQVKVHLKSHNEIGESTPRRRRKKKKN